MLTVAIREFDGAVLAQAAERRQVIGLTNDRQLAGVVIPISQAWIQHLIEQNLSRLLQNIQRGEREIRTARTAPTQSDGKPAPAGLDEVLEMSLPAGQVSRLRKVPLRKVDGSLIAEASARDEAVGITNNRILAGVLVPVSHRWVEQLVDQNFSRILFNVETGEKEIAAGDPPG